jgi:hypothetical protein
MSAEMTEFVDVIPVKSLRLVLDLAKGKPLDQREAGLALLNVVSYAAGASLPGQSFEPIALANTFGAETVPTDAERDDAFAAVLSDEHETASYAIGAGVWLVILKTALPLLLKTLVR